MCYLGPNLSSRVTRIITEKSVFNALHTYSILSEIHRNRRGDKFLFHEDCETMLTRKT